MARTHLYQPVLLPNGGLASYAAVTILDSITGLPTTVPLYADQNSEEPLDNPTQFSPGIIEFWADTQTRVDLRVTANGTIPLLIPGVDMLPSPDELLVISGGFTLDAVGSAAQVLKRNSGPTASWADVVLIPAHQHDGSGANSTLVGEQAATSAFSVLGKTGTSRGQETGASNSGKGGALVVAFQVSVNCTVNACKVWCGEDPGATNPTPPLGVPFDGQAFVGIASAIGSNPGGLTFLVKQSVEQQFVPGENLCQFPSVALVTGTTYYLVFQNPTSGASGHSMIFGTLASTGAVSTTSNIALYQGDSDATKYSLFNVTYTGVIGDSNLKSVTAKTTTISGSNSRKVTRIDCMAHISKGSRRGQVYWLGAQSLAASFPDGTAQSTTFALPKAGTIEYEFTGEAPVIDYYEFNLWYNVTVSPNEALVGADGYILDNLVHHATPGAASVGGTGASLRVKYAAGAGMDGLVIPVGAATEPTGQSAQLPATAWSATTLNPSFELGIMGTPVDAAAKGTWVGYKDFTPIPLSDTTVLGHGVRANANTQTLLGSNTTGIVDSAAKAPTQTVVIGCGSFGYQNSVTIGIGFGWLVETSPFVDLGQLGAYADHLIINPQNSLYADTNHGSYTVVTLGIAYGVSFPPASTNLVLLNADVVIPGKLTVSKDVSLAGATNKLGFFGSTGAVKPTTFAHQSNVALQNLLVALQALGLVVSS